MKIRGSSFVLLGILLAGILCSPAAGALPIARSNPHAHLSNPYRIREKRIRWRPSR